MYQPIDATCSLIDQVSFDERGKFVFSDTARGSLSLIFRYEIGLNTWLVILIGIIIVGCNFIQPVTVLDFSDFASGDWLYMQAVTLILFGLVGVIYRRNIFCFASILGIQGAPRERKNERITDVITDDATLSDTLFHTMFGKGWYDYMGIVAGILIPLYLLGGDWVFYQMEYGNWIVSIYSLWRTGIEIPFWVVPFRWIWATCWGFASFFAFSILCRISALVHLFSKLGKDDENLRIMRILAENSQTMPEQDATRDQDPLHISQQNAEVIGGYRKLWRFANTAFGFFYRFGMAIITIVIGLVGWNYSVIIYSPEITPLIVDITLLLFLMPVIVLAIAVVIIFSPMIGLVTIMGRVKEWIVFRTQDLYEETVVTYLSPQTTQKTRSELNPHLDTLNSVQSYVEDLPVWPIELHEKITLVAAGVGSYLIPLIVDWLII